jgi:hypothetical protein
MMRRLAALALFALPLSVLGQITSSSPSSIPAGLTTASLKLSGTFPAPATFSAAGYGVCVFNGSTGTYTSIAPDAENTTQIALTVPAANLNLNPNLFTNDQYDLVAFVSGPSGSCSAVDTSFSIQVLYPQIANTSLFAFPAPAGPTSPTTPNRVEITGTNFLQTGFNGALSNTFVQLAPATPATANLKFIANDGTTVTATLPLPTQITSGQTSLDIVPCNSNGTYTYCSTDNPRGANYFQLSASQVDMSPTPTTVLTGAATGLKVNLTATGSDAITDGGTYRVPAPGGIVTFTDGATVVGTAPAIGTLLGLSAVSLTPIAIDLPSPSFNSLKSFSVDLNGDGAPDVVLFDPGGPALHILLGGAPTGTLQNDQAVFIGGCASVPSLAFGDLNKDGYPDLVYSCADPSNVTSINYMLNNGDGTFAAPLTLPNAHGEQVAIADVNHDGIPDILVSGLTTANPLSAAIYGIQTYINDGTPNFTFGSLTTTTDSAGTQIQLVAQDLNNDGFADVGLLHYDANAGATVVAVYQNTQSNSFASAGTITVCSCIVTHGSLSFPSITGSKTFPDMAVVLSDNDLILIDAVNNKSSSLGFSSFSTTDYSPATSLVIGDYNGDGRADVATYDGSDVTVHASDGTGTFPNASTPLQQANSLILATAQDLNGDGLADLVALDTSSGINAYTFIADGNTSATLPYAFLTTGTHHMTATYSGSPAMYGSTGSTDILVSAPPAADVNVIVPPATTGSTSATQTYAAGGTLSMNFQVLQDAGDSRPSASPTGTVTIVENGSPVGTATLSPSATNVGTSTASLSNFESATTGTHNFTVTYSGDPNFSASTQTFPYTVVQQTPTVTWATPASIPFGTALSSTQLNAVAKDAAGNPLAGNFAYSPPATTILQVGNSQLSVDFSPTDAADFTSTGGQGVTVTQVVTADTTTTSLTTPSTANYGDQVTLTANVSTQLSSTINGSVTFTANGTTVGQGQLTGNVASVTVSTQNPAFVIGPNTIVATLTGTTNYATSSDTKTITLSKGTPVISWPPPANVATGTALSSIQLNAAAQDASGNTLSGNYVYNPAAGTTLSQGTTPLSVTFTPSAAISGHYNTATGNNSITALPPSTVAVAANPNPAIVQTAVNLTATVSSTGGIPTGSVTFLDNTTQTQIGTVTLVPGSSSSTASIAYTPTSTGTHTINTLYSGSGTIFSGNGSTDITVTVPPPTITWNPAVTSIAYGTPLTASELNATTTVPGTFTYSPNFGAVLPVNPQTILGVTFVPTDTSIPPASSSTLIAVTQFTPLVTWATPASIPYGTALSSTQLNAVAKDASGNTIPGAFTYSPNAGTVLSVGTTQLSVSFIPTDTTNYSSTGGTGVHVNQLVSLAPTTTAITITPTTANYGDTLTLNATVTSTPAGTVNGSILFTETRSQQTVASAQVINGVASTTVSTSNPVFQIGSNSIVGTFQATGQFATSTSTAQSFTLAQASPTITYNPTPTVITYGTALIASQLNATSSVPGSFSYSQAVGDILAAGSHTINATFTPTDTTHYRTIVTPGVITVSQFVPTIVWPTPSAVSTGTALSGTQLNASATGVGGIANLPGTFTYTPPSGTILATGSQTLNVLFTPTDASYSNATGTNHISVVLPPTTTTLTSSVDPTLFGQPTVLTATIRHTSASNGPITGTVSFFANGTLLGQPATVTQDTQTGAYAATLTIATLTAGSHALNATYSGDANNDTSDSTATSQGAFLQTVQTAQVTLLWTPAPATIPYGTQLSAAQLDAVAISPYVANVAASIIYNQPLGTILTAGVQTLTASVTPVDTADFTAGAGSTQIIVTQATPTITWATPAAITQGTALSATQLNATATGINQQSLPGTFTYNPVLGAVLPSGPNTLSVTFTPTDTVNYAAHTAQVILNVSIPAARVTVTSPTNPSQYGQTATLTATVVAGGTLTAIPTGSVTFFDSGKPLGTATLNAAGIASLPIATLTTGAHQITAGYLGDAANATATSTTVTQTITQAPSVVTFTPNLSTITYGTVLSAAQLDATATSAYLATVPGTFVYTPALGSTPGAGTSILSVTFTPTDTLNFSTATKTATLTVNRATPTLSFPNPADTVIGTRLSATQLNAVATGVGGATLPGAFTYTPAAGALVTAGAQTLGVSFTPTDITDYTTATTTATLNGVPVTITALSPNTATLGDPAKTITVTGTGFAPDAVVRVNGVPVTTTYVSGTSLSAVIPATSFAAVATLQITVNDPTQAQTTTALPITVTAPPVTINVTAPGTVTPTSQPVITFTLTNPYPVSVTGTFTLTFQSSAADGASDPNIVFGQSGTRTLSFTVPAGQTSTTSSTAIQAGTIAGNIVVTLTLQAGGIDVTPPGTAPVTINIPAVVPGITSVDPVVRSGKNLTVTVNGYSNTHQATQAKFHFVPVSGKTLLTPDLTVDITSLFNAWYTSTGSTTFGSAFGYDQPFTLDDDASIIASVTVTISNSVGASASGSTQ